MDADNALPVTGVDESYGEELIDGICEDCGSRLLRSYTGIKWCSKHWDSEKHQCKMKGHVKIDC